MASSRNFSNMLVIISIISLVSCIANAQLSANFYATSCPNVQTIVNTAMTQAVNNQPRIAASILRLFFHDCFVNGCDASLLLNATNGEQFAIPNNNSARGFDVIDTIKSQVEVSCNGTVSCADILALAARDGVVALGGPTWTVQLGRRDSTTASQSTANSDIPAPFDDLSVLIKKFSDKGLDAKDMTALSGGHTIGQAQCRNFRAHIYNDSDISASFGTNLQANCPATAPNGDSNLAPLDTQTSTQFDNSYYQNLVSQQGLLHSDQELFNGGSQDSLVTTYSNNQATFFSDFAAAMVKMGNISPLTGTNGEIRQFCGVTN